MDVRSIIPGFSWTRARRAMILKTASWLSFSFSSGLGCGPIYPAREKMGKDGLITLEMQAPGGTPNRRACPVAERGRQEFLSSIRKPFPGAPAIRLHDASVPLCPHPHGERTRPAHEHPEPVKGIPARLLQIEPEIVQYADRFKVLVLVRSGRRLLADLARNTGTGCRTDRSGPLKARSDPGRGRHIND